MDKSDCARKRPSGTVPTLRVVSRCLIVITATVRVFRPLLATCLAVSVGGSAHGRRAEKEPCCNSDDHQAEYSIKYSQHTPSPSRARTLTNFAEQCVSSCYIRLQLLLQETVTIWNKAAGSASSRASISAAIRSGCDRFKEQYAADGLMQRWPLRKSKRQQSQRHQSA